MRAICLTAKRRHVADRTPQRIKNVTAKEPKSIKIRPYLIQITHVLKRSSSQIKSHSLNPTILYLLLIYHV